MKFDAVIFDLDGTLVDTEPAAALAIEVCFAEWGLKLEDADSHYITGRTWRAACEYLCGKYVVPLPLEEASEKMVARYREELKTELKLVPGAANAVRALAQAGYRLALVSGSARAEIFHCLDALGVRPLFEVVLGCEDYARSKPAPDGFLKAMQLLGARPEATLIFEDSQAGIASALAAGARVVAIRATRQAGQDTGGAHTSVEDLSEVDAEWLKSYAP